MLHENLVPLNSDVSARRIFSPFAYRVVRELNVVPIVHAEASRLALWFPVAWRIHEEKIQLVTLRSLLPTIAAVPAPARSLEYLPALLQAYPFTVDFAQPVMPQAPKMLSEAVAEFPVNVGASITTADRKLSRATLQRFQALDFFCDHAPATQALSDALFAEALFQPWELKFDVEGSQIDIPDIFIVKQAAFETGAFAQILARHGTMAAQLLGIHRLSLFRAGTLLAVARAAKKMVAPEGGMLSSEVSDWAD
jgi:hypothetical protein